MSTTQSTNGRPVLDPSVYSLSQEELAFFKSQTGITDSELLRKHILEVQSKAYEIYPYQFIRTLSFTKLVISRLLDYKAALQVAKEREGAILLDIGCGFGSDTRKIVSDGWPAHNVIATDLREGFWECGHQLFKDTQSSFPVKFIAGDIFDTNLFPSKQQSQSSMPPPKPDTLETLTSFTPVQGHISVIYTALFFHLFDEENQLIVARRLAALLSPQPGSMIFGVHRGLSKPGYMPHAGERFFHSPESWKMLWDGGVFEKGTVVVKVELQEVESEDVENRRRYSLLVWSVTRV